MTDVYWLEQSEADVAANDEWLSDNDRASLDKMRFPKRRADWRLGRWTAKRAVAALLNLPDDPLAFSNIEIRPALTGAPEVFLANGPADLTISLSHRSGVAICAVAGPGVALGCDVEIVEPHSESFLADYFTVEEQNSVAEGSPADRWCTLAMLWSAKESALKALHEGFRLDTRAVIVIPTEPPRSQEKDRADCKEAASLATPPPYHVPCWRPLRVRHVNGQVFDGWWRHTGHFVNTLVAEPAPTQPIALTVPHHHPAQCFQSQKRSDGFDTVGMKRLLARRLANDLELTPHITESPAK